MSVLHRKKEQQKSLVIFLALFLISCIILWPLAAAFFTSFKPKDEIITTIPHFFPQKWTLDNYIRLIVKKNIFMYMKNSLIVSIGLTLINLILSLIGAFSFVWMKHSFKQVWAKLLLITYMFPTVLFAMPYYIMCNRLGLLNKSIGLIFTYLAFSLPFSIWMLKNTFEALPSELVEIGLIDGCSNIQCLSKIIVPISLPAVSVTAVYAFIIGSSEYMFASTLVTVENSRTLPIMLSMLPGRYCTDFGLLMAASMIEMLPIIFLYLMVQKYFVDGVISGAIKN